MTESEAIKEIRENMLCDYCIAGCDECDIESCSNKDAFSVAIKALEEVQQYRALEKHLSDMFGGSLSLKMCVDELERILVEPDSPHPMNAKILTYQEAADWEAYRAIGTVEELIRGKRYMNIAKHHGTIGQVIDECVAYEAIGTPEECRAAMEKQTAKKPDHKYIKYGKHKWKRDKDGKIDDFAWEYEFCNGVVCERCGESVCVHCNPDYDKLDDCEVNIYICPFCDKEVGYRQKYCDCGQKLDWRNEE